MVENGIPCNKDIALKIIQSTLSMLGGSDSKLQQSVLEIYFTEKKKII